MSDFTAMAGYGREVVPGLSLGGTVKLYSQSLPDVSGKGVTGDVGVLYVMDDAKLSFGAVARNLMGKVRYDNIAEDAFERAFGVGAATVLRIAFCLLLMQCSRMALRQGSGGLNTASSSLPSEPAECWTGGMRHRSRRAQGLPWRASPWTMRTRPIACSLIRTGFR